MDNFFGNLYGSFKGLYGDSLHDYLLGYDCSTGNYDGDPSIGLYGWSTLALAVLLLLIYYYIWQPVRHQKIKYWLSLSAVVLVAWLVPFYDLWEDLENGWIGDCLAYNISMRDIFNFALVNAFLAGVYFLVFSLFIKWGSKTCRYYPFRFF